ncbi:MAG: tetratricopeptide repeat protein, partial [Spirochaetaceae bacterium]|nr:tetratricopeptide repeat protein [Spirochaetaceae bacterium]
MSEDDPYHAIDSFRSALRINPAYADARLGMAEALFLLTEYEEAARELDEARPFASDRRDLVLLEARIITAMGRYDDAVVIYKRLLTTRPHDADANRGLAEIYAIIGQRELADGAYEISLRYSPGDRRVLLQLVLLHDEAREKAPANAALQEVLRLFPDNLAVRIQAAEHYALYDEWIAAMDHLDRAKSMLNGPEDKRYPRIGLLDAELSLRKGDPASALESLNSLPDLMAPEVLYLLARAYRDLGNELQAQNVLG